MCMQLLDVGNLYWGSTKIFKEEDACVIKDTFLSIFGNLNLTTLYLNFNHKDDFFLNLNPTKKMKLT